MDPQFSLLTNRPTSIVVINVTAFAGINPRRCFLSRPRPFVFFVSADLVAFVVVVVVVAASFSLFPWERRQRAAFFVSSL